MRILSMGAVLWDIYVDREYIGGAPFNLAGNMARLGAESAMYTRLGNDDLGRRALTELKNLGVLTEFVQIDDKLETGYSRVTFDESGLPHYELPVCAYDALEADKDTLEKMRSFAPDVICFGTIEQRGETTRRSMKTVLESIPARHVFFDVNLRMGFHDKTLIEERLKHTTIMKLNNNECEILSELLTGSTMPYIEFVGYLLKREEKIETVVVTLGEEGCYVRSRDGETFQKCRIASSGDTVGAGDAFSAGFLYAILSGKSSVTAAMCGNLLGSYTAMYTGALPVFNKELYAELDDIMKEGK